jgi:putative ABC transport system ATP-binding protein
VPILGSIMLRIRALTRPGLAPVDLDLAAGEAVALLGPSGSGKTLLLRAIADLDPNDGEVSLEGQDRSAMPAPAWRRTVTYLAAEPGWWASTPAAHFADPDAARALLPELKLSPALLDRPLTELSTGERHRIALVRVLIQEPKVLLLDEPTSGLDQDTTHAVEAVLRSHLARGTAVLFSTHDEELAARLAGRRIRLASGRVTASEAEEAT